jgi:hypothetical protein
MTTTINASTSSGLVVTPDNSGNVLLQYNGVAAPAFGVYQSSAQSISSGASIVQFQTKEFDTAGCFNNTGSTVTLNGLSVPAWSFCPNVAGYYQININVRTNISNIEAQSSIYKNGIGFKNGSDVAVSANASQLGTVAASVIYLNGTGDYIYGGIYIGGGSTTLSANGSSTYFNGCLLRGA